MRTASFTSLKSDLETFKSSYNHLLSVKQQEQIENAIVALDTAGDSSFKIEELLFRYTQNKITKEQFVQALLRK